MNTHKKQQRTSTKAAPHQPKEKLYLLRGDKLTDDLFGNVVDTLIAATASGRVAPVSPQGGLNE